MTSQRTCKTHQWGEELGGGGLHGRKEGGPKEAQGPFWSVGNVLYLALCNGYICVFTCQSSSNKMPKMYAFTLYVHCPLISKS